MNFYFPCVCGNVNFFWRNQCNKCKKNKNEHVPPIVKCIGLRSAEMSNGIFKAEDWQCKSCGNVNWARRQHCNRCNTDKFDPVNIEEQVDVAQDNDNESVHSIDSNFNFDSDDSGVCPGAKADRSYSDMAKELFNQLKKDVDPNLTFDDPAAEKDFQDMIFGFILKNLLKLNLGGGNDDNGKNIIKEIIERNDIPADLRRQLSFKLSDEHVNNIMQLVVRNSMAYLAPLIEEIKQYNLNSENNEVNQENGNNPTNDESSQDSVQILPEIKTERSNPEVHPVEDSRVEQADAVSAAIPSQAFSNNPTTIMNDKRKLIVLDVSVPPPTFQMPNSQGTPITTVGTTGSNFHFSQPPIDSIVSTPSHQVSQTSTCVSTPSFNTPHLSVGSIAPNPTHQTPQSSACPNTSLLSLQLSQSSIDSTTNNSNASQSSNAPTVFHVSLPGVAPISPQPHRFQSTHQRYQTPQPNVRSILQQQPFQVSRLGVSPIAPQPAYQSPQNGITSNIQKQTAELPQQGIGPIARPSASKIPTSSAQTIQTAGQRISTLGKPSLENPSSREENKMIFYSRERITAMNTITNRPNQPEIPSYEKKTISYPSYQRKLVPELPYYQQTQYQSPQEAQLSPLYADRPYGMEDSFSSHIEPYYVYDRLGPGHKFSPPKSTTIRYHPFKYTNGIEKY